MSRRNKRNMTDEIVPPTNDGSKEITFASSIPMEPTSGEVELSETEHPALDHDSTSSDPLTPEADSTETVPAMDDGTSESQSPSENSIWVSFVTEKKIGQGQDGPPIRTSWKTSEGTRSIIAVFDGMGGAGSTLVPDIDADRQIPMAYLASRAAARAFEKCFSQITPTMSCTEIATQLEQTVQRELIALMERDGGKPESRVKGDLVKNYPTTIAAAIIDDIPEGRRVHPLWAGDSRIYALLPDELLLQQLTIDHTSSGDSSDGGDAALTRCATPENVDLESAEYLLPRDAIIFAATDGCFAYQSTQFLLTSLIEDMVVAGDADQYSHHLANTLSAISGDDCAISMLFPAAASYTVVRENFRPLLRDLQDIRNIPRNNRFLTLSDNSLYLRLYRMNRGG